MATLDQLMQYKKFLDEQNKPLEYERVDAEPIEYEPVKEQMVDYEPVNEQPQPLDYEPVSQDELNTVLGSSMQQVLNRKPAAVSKPLPSVPAPAQTQPSTTVPAEAAPQQSYEAELKEAQQRANLARALGSFAQAGGRAGMAIGGQPIDESYLKSVGDWNADQHVKDIQELQKARDIDTKRGFERQFSDPSSAISKLYRQKILIASPKMAEIPDFDKLTAQQLKEMGFKISQQEEMSAYQKQMLDIYRTRLEHEAEREKRLGDTLQWKKVEKDEPSDKQTDAINALDQTIGSLDEIKELKPAFDTGPIAGRVAAMRQLTGNDDAKMTSFKSKIGRNLANYIKSMSGTAVSDKEREFLKGLVPNENMSDEAFIQTLSDFRREVENTKSRQLESIRRGGKNVDKLIAPNLGVQEAPVKSAKTSKKEAQDDGMVAVISPEGKKGRIPRANLQKALDKGYQLAK